MQNKYLLFSGVVHKLSGGWNDFKGSFKDLEAAKNAFDKNKELNETSDWAHIVDLEQNKIIAEKGLFSWKMN
jgi:hypothetical protein